MRQDRDGRTLVYGILIGAIDGDDRRGGELLEPGADILAAIRSTRSEYSMAPDGAHGALRGLEPVRRPLPAHFAPPSMYLRYITQSADASYRDTPSTAREILSRSRFEPTKWMVRCLCSMLAPGANAAAGEEDSIS